MDKPQIGSVAWRDLTVPNAAELRDFYCAVVGWKSAEHPMGDYADYNILAPESGECVAGICHARGPNANVPAQWLIYITVADVEQSAARCRALGGAVLDGPRSMGAARMCVIRDPAGAVAALYQPG